MAVLDNVIVRRLIGWLIVATSIYTILLVQVRSVVSAETGLPDIRHPVFWHHDLYEQALANRSKAISTELAPFYLIERLLEHRELIVGRPLEEWRWKLETIGRVRVIMDYSLGELPSEPWRDLGPRASHTIMFSKRQLYLLADPTVTTYVFVATEGGPLYIVPEPLYRSRVADRSGANLSAP